MTDDPKFVAKIQKFYDDLNHKLIEAQNLSMIAKEEFHRKVLSEAVSFLTELINDYDKIFSEYLYKEKL